MSIAIPGFLQAGQAGLENPQHPPRSKTAGRTMAASESCEDGQKVSRDNSLGDLPFLLLPVNQVWLLLKGFVRLTQKRVGYGFNSTGIEILERRRFFELHF
jgi:hypothetical protein